MEPRSFYGTQTLKTEGAKPFVIEADESIDWARIGLIALALLVCASFTVLVGLS